MRRLKKLSAALPNRRGNKRTAAIGQKCFDWDSRKAGWPLHAPLPASWTMPFLQKGAAKS